jgi:uncharacterized DUF497 family protein
MVYFLSNFGGGAPEPPVFEFDEAKSRMNRRKHGIDFTEAQALWSDPRRAEIPARTEGEPRFLIVGEIDGMRWAAVVTYRGEAVRIISVRRARPEEIAIYEGH